MPRSPFVDMLLYDIYAQMRVYLDRPARPQFRYDTCSDACVAWDRNGHPMTENPFVARPESRSTLDAALRDLLLLWVKRWRWDATLAYLAGEPE